MKEGCFAGSLDVFYLLSQKQDCEQVYALWQQYCKNKMKFHKEFMEKWAVQIVASLSFSQASLSSMTKINLLEMDLNSWQTFDDLKDSPLSIRTACQLQALQTSKKTSKGFWGSIFSFTSKSKNKKQSADSI